jgi:hypothetical protein
MENLDKTVISAFVTFLKKSKKSKKKSTYSSFLIGQRQYALNYWQSYRMWLGSCVPLSMAWVSPYSPEK